MATREDTRASFMGEDTITKLPSHSLELMETLTSVHQELLHLPNSLKSIHSYILDYSFVLTVHGRDRLFIRVIIVHLHRQGCRYRRSREFSVIVTRSLFGF